MFISRPLCSGPPDDRPAFEKPAEPAANAVGSRDGAPAALHRAPIQLPEPSSPAPRAVTQVALTKRQREILDYYRGYATENGYSPTLEEAAQHFGVNKVTIFGHISELERKGVLVRAAKGVSRGVLIADRDSEANAGAAVTILGRIAAGAPIEAIESPERMELADLVPSDRDVYALRVSGTSMIEDGIHDGDLVLVERRNHAHNGEMVVAVLPDEEATLKRLYRENGRYRLQPANSALSPVWVDRLEIRGVVIGVIRRY